MLRSIGGGSHMSTEYLTIKELTEAVGGGLTPRMVRHYHQVNILPPAYRSESNNYRLYSSQDVQRLKKIVALKEQGFQLSHIRQIVESNSSPEMGNTLISQLHQQYQNVIKQLVKLRRTASALESLLGRDHKCQIMQAEVIAQLKHLEVTTQEGEESLSALWQALDQRIDAHAEVFAESLEHLLPDEFSSRNEIERDLLAKLVLASGDVSLVDFVRLSPNAITAAREALKRGCQVIGDVPTVTAAFDQTRLAHLHCSVSTLLANPHISSVAEAEEAFCRQDLEKERLLDLAEGNILVVGYAPSVLISICNYVAQGLKPALIIGMPIGFSHAPGAKRQLMSSNIPYLTVEGTLGGGILAAVALNALVESLLDKPNCHCHLVSTFAR